MRTATNRHELNSNQQALLELVRAGLWRDEARISQYGKVDYPTIRAQAEAQGVIGLIAAGLEYADVRPSQIEMLNIVGSTLQIEQRNEAMNDFIADIVERMRAEDIYTLLVKGQGVAQCYEKPLWRPSGDVDFLLSEDNYKKARTFLLPLSSGNKDEERYSQHLGMNIGKWYVEIHGSLRTGLTGRIDRVVDEVQNDVFYDGNVRSWQNEKTQVFLPAPTNDVFLVFTHFIKHFYKEGMSLRQVCDWCRLLWTYRDTIDLRNLELWIRRAGLMGEWRAFGTLAVNRLGMPETAMPLFNGNHNTNLSEKAEKLIRFILVGSSGDKVKDTYEIAKIFPWHTIKFLPSIFLNVNGLKIKERLISKDSGQSKKRAADEMD